MKKLLALILCVMMFASLSVNAFAAGTTGGEATHNAGDLLPKYQASADAKKAVTDIGKDIKAMYTAIAADNAVFGTAKTIYDMTDNLAKEMLKDTEKIKINGVDVYQEDLIDNVRKGLNHIIADEITNYMNDRVSNFTNDDGNIKPDKYINTFAKAVSNALTSTKAQRNIQAIVYGIAAINAQKSVNDKADDLYDDIVEWDHWGEFGWGLADPDGNYAEAWLPVGTTLIPTASTTAGADAALAAGMVAGLYNAD